MTITVNAEKRLFVVPCVPDGYTCFGFDNCFRDSMQLSMKLNRSDLAPKESEIGQLSQYSNYLNLLKIASNSNFKETWFSPGTHLEVQRILENTRLNNKKIRIWYGDPAVGLSWMDEFEMYGKIGRSMGTLKSTLMMGKGDFGDAILTNRIIKIVEFNTRAGVEIPKVLFQTENFHLPTMTIVENEHPDYPATVSCDGFAHARFKTLTKAQNWIAFMEGKRSTT